MRVLFLSQVLPYPPHSGPQIRIYNVLKHLAQEHQVTLVSFIRSEREREQLPHLSACCQDVHTIPLRRSRVKDVLYLLHSLATNQPFIIVRDRVPAMTQKVRSLAGSGGYHVVHADQLNMAQYALSTLNSSSRTRRPALLLDEHNAVYTIPQRLARQERNPFKRLLLELEWRKLARYEAEVCCCFDHVITVTEQDYQALEAAINNSQFTIHNSRFTTIPIAVDCAEIPVIERNHERRNILSIATMFWPPNVDGVLWFAREVFPLVRQQVSDARFYVVGKNPPKAIRRLQSSYQPSAISHQPIVVTGYVEDPTPYFADSGVFIVPLRAGGGMRVKILDAWARGIPIVSTTIGCEGIEARHGENILVADTPLDFAQAVVRVIQDGDLAQRLVENGRQWVEEEYDWRVVYRKLDDVYEKLGQG